MPSHRDTARQFPWDRVPVVTGVTYANPALAAAAGITVLGTFTLPAGKAGTLDNMSVAAVCTVAVAALNARFYQDWTDGITNAILVIAAASGAAVGNVAYANVGASGWIRPGQQVRLLCDASAAGSTWNVLMGIKITECQP